jgi:hypothetical protein
MSVAQLQNSYVNAEGGSTSALPYITWNPAYPGRPTTKLDPPVAITDTNYVNVSDGIVPIYAFGGQVVIVGTVQIATDYNNIAGEIRIRLRVNDVIISNFIIVGTSDNDTPFRIYFGSYYTFTLVGVVVPNITGVLSVVLEAYQEGGLTGVNATSSSLIAYAETV